MTPSTGNHMIINGHPQTHNSFVEHCVNTEEIFIGEARPKGLESSCSNANSLHGSTTKRPSLVS